MDTKQIFIPISAVLILAAQGYQWITGRQEMIVSVVLALVALYLLVRYATSIHRQRKSAKPSIAQYPPAASGTAMFAGVQKEGARGSKKNCKTQYNPVPVAGAHKSDVCAS